MGLSRWDQPGAIPALRRRDRLGGQRGAHAPRRLYRSARSGAVARPAERSRGPARGPPFPGQGPVGVVPGRVGPGTRAVPSADRRSRVRRIAFPPAPEPAVFERRAKIAAADPGVGFPASRIDPPRVPALIARPGVPQSFVSVVSVDPVTPAGAPRSRSPPITRRRVKPGVVSMNAATRLRFQRIVFALSSLIALALASGAGQRWH